MLFSAAKTNFDLVKSGTVTWDEIDVNYRRVVNWIAKNCEILNLDYKNKILQFRNLISNHFYNHEQRTFSLNFGVRAGTQEDYDWIEQQMYDGDDFQTFATALSWMTDTEASIPIIERVR